MSNKPTTLEEAAEAIRCIQAEKPAGPLGSWAHRDQSERLITPNRVYIEIRNRLAAERITADDIALDDELAQRRLERRARERREFADLFSDLGRMAL